MDRMLRMISHELNVRIYAVEVPETVREITRIHETTPNATSALGKGIIAASLLGATLKPESDQNLTLRVQGSGPLKEIFVQVDSAGNMRGFTSNPQIDIDGGLERISFSDAIGAGMITVSKDLGLKEPYSGVSPIIRGELAEDLTYYLAKSEQIPSAMILGLKLDENGGIAAAGGILIQTFPDTPETSIEQIEKNIEGIEKSLGESLAGGEDITDFASKLAGGHAAEIISETSVQHRCRCSREILRNVVKTLTETDIEEMINEDHGTEIHCTFCGKSYSFTEQDLKDILEEKRQ